MKLCKGALHSEGVWLPADTDHFFKRSAGLSDQFQSQCRQCRAHYNRKTPRQAYGWVKVHRVQFIFIELENRVGRKEAARRCKINSAPWKKIIESKQQHVEKETLRRAIEQLRICRSNNEVRNRRDIQYGSAKRGLPEKPPTERKDFYRPHGDTDTEMRRKSADRA